MGDMLKSPTDMFNGEVAKVGSERLIIVISGTKSPRFERKGLCNFVSIYIKVRIMV